MAEHKHNPFEHVQDTDIWQFFTTLFGDKQEIQLPGFHIFNYHFQITKFMILELVAAALILVIYIPIARRSSTGELPKGRWWNAFESLLTFVRNEIAKPNLGEKDADKYVPYLWTLFLFLLFCNLLGMFPFMGSPTANIWATGALALISFIMLHGAAIVKMGYEPPGAHGHGHGYDHDEGHGQHLETGHHEHAAQKPQTSRLGRRVNEQQDHRQYHVAGEHVGEETDGQHAAFDERADELDDEDHQAE